MTSTSHANERGNAAQRRARKVRLVADYGWPDEVEPEWSLACCWLCAVPMVMAEITVDRALPGIQGGTYAYTNCRPCCLACNLERGGRLGAERRFGAVSARG